MLGRDRTADTILNIYNRQTDTGLKESAIDALFIQQNAETLVALARKETDRDLKRRIVSKLVADAITGRARLHDGAAQVKTGFGVGPRVSRSSLHRARSACRWRRRRPSSTARWSRAQRRRRSSREIAAIIVALVRAGVDWLCGPDQSSRWRGRVLDIW